MSEKTITIAKFLESYRGRLTVETQKEYQTRTDGNGDISYPILDDRDLVVAWWYPEDDRVEVRS